MVKQKKGLNDEPRAYTIEELEAMIKSATQKLTMAKRTLNKIYEFSEEASKAYYELMQKKNELEKELAKYSSIFSVGKSAIKAMFSGKENEAKAKQKELGDELVKLQALIDEKLSDIQSLESCAVSKEEKIQNYQKEINRWNAKLRKRQQNAIDAEQNSPTGPQ